MLPHSTLEPLGHFSAARLFVFGTTSMVRYSLLGNFDWMCSSAPDVALDIVRLGAAPSRGITCEVTGPSGSIIFGPPAPASSCLPTSKQQLESPDRKYVAVPVQGAGHWLLCKYPHDPRPYQTEGVCTVRDAKVRPPRQRPSLARLPRRPASQGVPRTT